MDAKEFKKLLRTIKLPGTAIATAGDNYAAWSKRGGHAGKKTILKVLEAAETVGFKRKTSQSGCSPSGSTVANESVLEFGFVTLFLSSSYGVTDRDNYFSVNVKVG